MAPLIQFSSYSGFNPAILEPSGRLRIANQILAIFRLHTGSTSQLSCLDIGCSSGVITDFLRPHFQKIIGIDVDKNALPRKKNFLLMNAACLKFPNNSFDVVICNQIYQCLNRPDLLVSEIFRVLKPNGICFFGAINKYAVWDYQVRLHYSHCLTYRQLRHLCSQFIIHDYTPAIINLRFPILSPVSRLIPPFILPNCVWLLQKPAHTPSRSSST